MRSLVLPSDFEPAIGSSAACMWTTIHFTVHKLGAIIQNFGNIIFGLFRFIVDMIKVWLGRPFTPIWDGFRKEINNFGTLEWEFEGELQRINFLDLTILIEEGTINTKSL